MWGPRPFCTITGLKTSGAAAACPRAGVRRAVRTAGAAPASAVAHPPIVSAPECRRNVRRCIGPDTKVRGCVGPDTLHHDAGLTESTCHFISELDAQADLDIARPVGGAVRLTERAGAQLSVQEPELRVIEQVQNVGPELEGVSLQGEPLGGRE